MIKYIDIWKKIGLFLFKKISSSKLIFNISKSNKINYFRT